MLEMRTALPWSSPLLWGVQEEHLSEAVSLLGGTASSAQEVYFV